MKQGKKKSPNDYPLFSFRVTQDEKEQLSKEILAVAASLNKDRTEDERAIRGNHVAVEALKVGLKIVKQRGIRG
jgi:hypothetical protein